MVLYKSSVVGLLGLSTFFATGALLSVVTKKTFLNMHVSRYGVTFASNTAEQAPLCYLSDKSEEDTIHFVSCGGFF